MYIFIVFFFKQKTAYEMRISDWSSDVCSSDLKAIEANPNLAQPYVNLGMVLREQKKFEEALQYARKGAELDPGSGAAQSNLGNVYMDLQRYKEAVVCFRRAMEFQPSFATRDRKSTRLNSSH